MPYTPGPFDSSHLYLQWGGSLPGLEEFSCGVRLASTDGASTSLDPAGMLAGATAAVKAMHQSSVLAISGLANLQFVKLNYINPDGHYAEGTTFQSLFPDWQGGQNLPAPPNQVAWAVSLTTGVSRGLAHRGRFYLPLPTQTVASDGLVSVSARDAALPPLNTFLTAINALDPGYKVAVFSRKAGAPTHRLVTGIQLGRVLDTQRRRRRSLPEQY